MPQENAKGKASVNMTPSRSKRQTNSWFDRHTKDESDASLAEFERLMAAMGYRQRATESGGAPGRGASAR